MMKTFMALFIISLSIIGDASAAVPPNYQEEVRRFMEVHNQVMAAKEAEECWNSILALERLLSDYPNTFLQGDISRELFTAYSKVVNDPEFLLRLAERAIALQAPTSGLYEEVASVFVDKKILQDKALRYSKKALELAEQMYASNRNYRNQIIRNRFLLGKAYQLANQPEDALKEMKRGLQEVEEWTATIPDLAVRKTLLDRAKLDLLKLYIDQKQWEPAYELACDLLANSLTREQVPELWSTSYVGKFGSAEGIGTAYASLKEQWEKHRKSRLTAERIKRPAPVFALRTAKDDSLSLKALKGKIVVVSLWAGWCGPCLKELPQLEQLKGTFGKQPVEFLAINMDQGDVETRKKMIWGQMALSAPSLTYLLGNEEIQKAFGIVALPYNCIIDQEGNIRYEQTGLSADFKASLKDQLAWLLGEVVGKKSLDKRQ